MLHIITINGCMFCQNLVNFLNENEIKYTQEIAVDKEKYKTDKIKTFPQVYFIVKKERMLIGGYTEFVTLYSKITNIKDFTKFLGNDWTKKNKLRLLKYLLT